MTYSNSENFLRNLSVRFILVRQHAMFLLVPRRYKYVAEPFFLRRYAQRVAPQSRSSFAEVRATYLVSFLFAIYLTTLSVARAGRRFVPHQHLTEIDFHICLYEIRSCHTELIFFRSAEFR